MDTDGHSGDDGVLGIVPLDIITGVRDIVPVDIIVGVRGIVPVDIIVGVRGMVPVDIIVGVDERKSTVSYSWSIILSIRL